MAGLFNKTFWKFACGFVGILVFGLLVFIVIGYAEYTSELEQETARVSEH